MSIPARTPQPTHWRRAVVVGILIAALVSLIVIAFTWPTRVSVVHEIPVAIAGPAAQTSRVETALTSGNDTFDVRRVDDRAAAVRLIRSRDVYGAIVLTVGSAPEVLTASAASPAVSQVMGAVAAKLQAQRSAAATRASGSTAAPAGPAVRVTDVVPLSDADPSGGGLVAAGFPLVMGGMLGGVFLTFLVHGTRRRLVGLGVYVVVGGLAVSGILQGWFGILQGSYLANAGAFTLALAAIAGTILGASALIGRIGVSTGPVLFLLFANPVASAGTPTSFLPAPWRSIGQWFPPGASTRLIRDISYFPHADSTLQWVVLADWTAVGLALMVVGAAVHRGRSHGRHRHDGEHVARVEHELDPLTV
ncbi:hypothetical protein [Curtobacterium sp. ISL-83]|uniref:hypothetical protein n=1 Tax=Curtobacterium sp. ISL-83 TaxID=2819145 RepID=UPI001BE7718D|nr:hypothetical protein [Curtobacterium sp. ISL-83]MBT2502120.1 hypothetical protein [Curtobacterium sp. ISL-83]